MRLKMVVNMRARVSPLEWGWGSTLWNMTIGEPVPVTWEPLLMGYGKCRGGDLVAAQHSLKWHKAQRGKYLVSKLRGPQECSICIFILYPQNSLDLLGLGRNSTEETVLLRNLSANADLTWQMIGMKLTKSSGGASLADTTLFLH